MSQSKSNTQISSAEKRRNKWSPDSWRYFPVKQLPEYPNVEELEAAYAELRQYPPLVSSWEIDGLKSQLAKASAGEAFLLQAGDCAESFDNCRSDYIVKLLKVLLQMSFIMIHEMHTSVIRVGRLAGQYAKPRSKNTEKIDGTEYPIYRGDLINAFELGEAGRVPDPQRLVEAYHKSGLTLNFLRALTGGGGFADLHHPEYWELDFMRKNKYYREYESMVQSITNAIHFMEGVLPNDLVTLRHVDLFTSHEALNLYYDSSQTRQVPHKTGFYNLSTHMPWLGNRTRDIGHAHVEYLRGIANPIGVKAGPPLDIKDMVDLIGYLNPANEPGKITLITRFGNENINDGLPDLINAVNEAKLNVVWSCDPMHGNTYATDENIKTRNFNDILDEIRSTFAIHRKMNTILGGVHLEVTGEDVTECVGGANGLSAHGLKTNYRSYCDPRLNYEQSLEMAFLISREWKASRGELKK